MKLTKTCFAACVTLAAALAPGLAGAADKLPATELRIVGSLSNLGPYKDHELPFWSEHIPQQSGGALKVEIRGFDQMGMKGPEVLRLLGQGVMEFAGVPMYYLAADDPAIEMIDIAGLLPDAATARKVTEATRGYYEKLLRSKFKVELLGLGAFPAQVLYCNAPIASLKDVAGKKVRVGGRSQSELMAALGATPVTMSFGEVVPALQTGAVDCGITGAMSGNLAKWHEVTTHLFALPMGWAQIAYAANQKSWAKLDPKVRAFIKTEMKTLEDRVWAAADKETGLGYACNAGAEGCVGGNPGKMTVVQPSDEDRALLQKLQTEQMLPKWLERCKGCAKDFDATVGPIVGVKAGK